MNEKDKNQKTLGKIINESDTKISVAPGDALDLAKDQILQYLNIQYLNIQSLIIPSKGGENAGHIILNEVYLIEEIWINPLNNDVSSAVGYGPHGFVYPESIAQKICNEGRKYTKKDCWAINDTLPQFRYELFSKIE